MKKSQNMIELEDLAASQWGLFTTAQAQELGLRRNQVSRMVSAGKAEAVGYGVYHFAAGDETNYANVKAAWLSVYPKEAAYERFKKRPYDAVVCGRTAAFMHGIGDFYASPYTFAVSERKQTNREDMQYFQRVVAESDIVFIDELPVASIERTVYDLIKSHEDPDLVDKFMADASRKKEHFFDRQRLSELLAPLAFKNGFAKGDGESFAVDLISRNAADIQIENAGKKLTQAFGSLYSQKEMQKIADSMQLTLSMLADNDFFKSSQEAARLAFEVDTSMVTRTIDILKRKVLPSLPSMPDFTATLPKIAIPDVLPTASQIPAVPGKRLKESYSSKPMKENSKNG